jgi:8-oxo-dGTP diphosphatase
VHRWIVAGALVERDGALLLVRNRRRDGRADWSPPGGVIDEGEGLITGLGREVHEETGLQVERWMGPAYLVEAQAPEMDWHLRVEVHIALEVVGELRVDDPDGIVEEADFVEAVDVEARLDSAPRWVAEPLLDWVEHRRLDAPTFRYEVRGTPAEGLKVERRP